MKYMYFSLVVLENSNTHIQAWDFNHSFKILITFFLPQNLNVGNAFILMDIDPLNLYSSFKHL